MASVQRGADTSGGRPGRRRRTASSLAEINVVPLVDVMLVLLVIFMITAPMIQRGVDMNLPVSRRASQIEGEPIFVSVPLEYRQSRMVYLGDERIRVDVLEERVRQRVANLSDKQVFLRGDAQVQFQDLMDIFDRLQGAGVQKIGIVAKRPGER